MRLLINDELSIDSSVIPLFERCHELTGSSSMTLLRANETLKAYLDNSYLNFTLSDREYVKKLYHELLYLQVDTTPFMTRLQHLLFQEHAGKVKEFFDTHHASYRLFSIIGYHTPYIQTQFKRAIFLQKPSNNSMSDRWYYTHFRELIDGCGVTIEEAEEYLFD